MANSNNGGDNRSYEENFSLPAVVGPVVPPTDHAIEVVYFPAPDPTSGTNAPAPTPTLDQTVGAGPSIHWRPSTQPSVVLKLAEQENLSSCKR
ncbi:UNVERIFIED_CONTAM: hypothetical protein Slati_1945200 [Sesamum latifolium]|uniref:Uncharacterized protein n=1 Tax=Sesamum latifolium TaxID=2727402 RepID=A0AAW2X2W9_9LAMI